VGINTDYRPPQWSSIHEHPELTAARKVYEKTGKLPPGFKLVFGHVRRDLPGAEWPGLNYRGESVSGFDEIAGLTEAKKLKPGEKMVFGTVRKVGAGKPKKADRTSADPAEVAQIRQMWKDRGYGPPGNRAAGQTKLSKAVADSNKKNAPPGGWKSTDKVVSNPDRYADPLGPWTPARQAKLDAEMALQKTAHDQRVALWRAEKAEKDAALAADRQRIAAHYAKHPYDPNNPEGAPPENPGYGGEFGPHDVNHDTSFDSMAGLSEMEGGHFARRKRANADSARVARTAAAQAEYDQTGEVPEGFRMTFGRITGGPWELPTTPAEFTQAAQAAFSQPAPRKKITKMPETRGPMGGHRRKGFWHNLSYGHIKADDLAPEFWDSLDPATKKKVEDALAKAGGVKPVVSDVDFNTMLAMMEATSFDEMCGFSEKGSTSESSFFDRIVGK
jgi:hypothetical protein